MSLLADTRRELDLAESAGLQLTDSEVMNYPVTGKNGAPLDREANAVYVLERAETLREVFRFNEFNLTIYVFGETPWGDRKGATLSDDDITNLTIYLQTFHGINLPRDRLMHCVSTVARRNGFHPVRDYLTGLKHDGKPRLHLLLVNYLKCDHASRQWAEIIGRKFMVSAVARIMEPGCKADCMLIFEGDQGLGKSKAVRGLCGPEYLMEGLADFHNDDTRLAMQGKWIVEIAELTAFKQARYQEQIKYFVSQQVDRFRIRYEKLPQDFPRQCVFIGTTNQTVDTLADATGNRRFWPVYLKQIDIAAIERDRDQLWAEAVAMYRAGVKWWLEGEKEHQLADEEQRRRSATDPWCEPLDKWLAGSKVAYHVSAGRFPSLTECYEVLEIPTDKRTSYFTTRITTAMCTLGWTRTPRKRVRGGTGSDYFFLPPSDCTHE